MVGYKDRAKRGCQYCGEVVKKRVGAESRLFCPHEICPYSELNKYDSYQEYMKANSGDPNILKYFAALERSENLRNRQKISGDFIELHGQIMILLRCEKRTIPSESLTGVILRFCQAFYIVSISGQPGGVRQIPVSPGAVQSAPPMVLFSFKQVKK